MLQNEFDDYLGGGTAVKKRPLPGVQIAPMIGAPMIAPPVGASGARPPVQDTAQPPAPQPMVTPPVQTGTPGADDYLTDFGPGNDLQGTQINPTPSGRLQNAKTLTDQAQQGLAGQPGFTPFKEVGGAPDFTGIAAPGTYDPSAEAKRARELTAKGLEGLVGAPSRQDLALQSYDALEKSSLADANAATREAFQRNAAGGRLGSGMLDENVGDIFGQRKLKLADARAGLARDTAGQELDDRLKKLNAYQGAGRDFTGQDLETAGFGQGLRGEARGERGAGLDYATRLRDEARTERGTQRDFQTGDLNRARSLLSDQSGEEQRQVGNERLNRDEVRGERGYQTDRSDKALNDRIQQKMLEDSLLNSQFGRDLSTSKFEADQAGVNQDQADQSGQAGSDLIQSLLSSGLSEADIRQILGVG